MRVRSTVTGEFTPFSQRREWSRTNCTSGFTPGSPSNTLGGTVVTKTISDVKTPGFHRIQQCGGFLPINPLVIETITETREPGTGNHEVSAGGCLRTYYDPAGLNAPSSDWRVGPGAFDEDIIQYVVNGAAADAKAAAWDALTAAAEAAESAALLAQTVKRFFRFAMKLGYKAKKKARKPGDAIREFNSLWLEYRYGWMPMVYDAQDIATALASKAEAGDILRGRSYQQTELKDTVRWSSDPSGVELREHVQNMKGTRTYRGKAYSRVTSSSRAKFGRDISLTAWEKVPFSFVVDWFVDVNSYIQAVSPFSGAELLGVGCSVKDEYELEWFFHVNWHGSSGGVSHSGDGYSSSKLKVERYTRFPSEVALPGWNPRLSPERVMDLLALILSGRGTVMRLLL